MLFYFTLFLLFLYQKIARVRYKEEKRTVTITLQNLFVTLLAVNVVFFGVLHTPWYLLVLLSFLFFIVSALMITAIQLGIFVDGKPLFGMRMVYKLLPFLTAIMLALSATLWL